MRDQAHPDHVGRGPGRLVRPFDHLYAATLATSAGVNLRLDDNGAAPELFRRDPGIRGGEYDFSLRHRHAVAGQDGLRLILVDFHESIAGSLARLIVVRAIL